MLDILSEVFSVNRTEEHLRFKVGTFSLWLAVFFLELSDFDGRAAPQHTESSWKCRERGRKRKN